MSDATEAALAVEAPKGFVTVERTVKIKDYEPFKCSLMLQVPSKPGDTLEDLVAASKDSFFVAKAVVLEQLGIPFDVSAENIVVERFEAGLGAVEVTPLQEAQAVAAAAPPRVSGGNAITIPPKDELWAELCAHPERWWDNRVGKRSPAAPDFKRKGPRDGPEQPALWLEFKGKSNLPEGLTLPTSGFAGG